MYESVCKNIYNYYDNITAIVITENIILHVCNENI